MAEQCSELAPLLKNQIFSKLTQGENILEDNQVQQKAADSVLSCFRFSLLYGSATKIDITAVRILTSGPINSYDLARYYVNRYVYDGEVKEQLTTYIDDRSIRGQGMHECLSTTIDASSDIDYMSSDTAPNSFSHSSFY